MENLKSFSGGILFILGLMLLIISIQKDYNWIVCVISIVMTGYGLDFSIEGKLECLKDDLDDRLKGLKN